MIRLVLALGFCAVLSLPATGQTPQERFDEANGLLTRGAAPEARAVYESLRSSGVRDPALEHNLGNAYVRTQALGRAVGAYRRGLSLEPDPRVAEALQRNLDIVRRRLQERYRSGEDGRHFIYADPGGFLYRLTHLYPSSTLTWAAIALWWLLLLLLGLRRLRPSWTWPGPASIPVAIVTLVALAMLWGQTRLDREIALGVVVLPTAALQDGPHPDARGVPVAEGMEVRILESRGGWSQVELAGGRRGWVANTAIEAL
jgi:hypothetical protein